MLTFRCASYDTDSTTDGSDSYGYMYFECPNPGVARTFIEAFNRIDASTWSDCHTILSDEMQVVDGPPDDHSCFYSWDDIQSDESLHQEMLAC